MNNGVWKWISGCLIALIVTNVTTFLIFKTSESTIAGVVERTFTDISKRKSLYSIEGRVRVDKLENKYDQIQCELKQIQIQLGKIDSKIDRALP